MTAAAGCKLSMGSANAEPGPAEPQPGGRSRRPPPAARSGAWGSAERRAQPGAEPGAASGSGSTAADGAGQRLPSRLGKSFPDPSRFPEINECGFVGCASCGPSGSRNRQHRPVDAMCAVPAALRNKWASEFFLTVWIGLRSRRGYFTTGPKQCSSFQVKLLGTPPPLYFAWTQRLEEENVRYPVLGVLGWGCFFGGVLVLVGWFGVLVVGFFCCCCFFCC
ncbi:uncharacterized protein LOC128150285 isoform X1 [Harpia harpyja]|uniref:uncharacterized protein LOC128150285 isoform X1 n=1 Tax=Harpia harpyja TaxID=202280 RepID=UPI0022B09027|nr:uncharacterized protein LOC128150285 isoform X1 [Harpia harpyja]